MNPRNVLIANTFNAVRAKTTKPLIIKLAPNVADIKVFARAAQECGADAVSIMNSYPAMAINIETRRPELWNRIGGLSGPAIKPVAVKLVHDAWQASGLPIIGMGGIMTGDDAVEFLLAGASAVAVGTAIFVDPYAPIKVIKGIEDYLERQGCKNVKEIVGAMVR